MNRQQKQTLVDELHKNFSDSQAAFLVNYKGLTVAQLQRLRTGLREQSGHLKIAKMRLVKRALDGISIQSDWVPYCKNQSGVVFAQQDSSKVAKILYDFSKNNSLELVAGVMNSQFLNSNEVIRIATLPSREVLLAQLCATMNGPVTQLARLLQALAEKRSSEQAQKSDQ